jgi:DNA-binding transcriptional ArsR family regulator
MSGENDKYSDLTDFDRILHSPARLTITAILSAVEEVDFVYLLNESGLTKGNLSTHLSKLEETGYIEIEKTYRGKIPLTLCRLTASGRTAFNNYRNQLKRFVDFTGEE